MISIKPPPDITLIQGGIIAADWQVSPEELQLSEPYRGKRKREFLTGRDYARKAMNGFHPNPPPLASDVHRCPIWPEGLVGSITHTRDYCAVAVARKSDYVSIGMDVEVLDSISERMEAKICTEPESMELRTLPVPARKNFLGLLFCAKEAFYKLQFPISKSWMGFRDVAVSIDQDGVFSIRLLKTVAGGLHAGHCFKGRFAFSKRHVSALMALEHS